MKIISTSQLLAILVVTGCSGATTTDTPPELEIVTPDRGALNDSGAVTVSGLVRDDGPVRVVVNGTDATVAKDGTFSVTLEVTPGITLLETHAIDTTGNDVRDVRAVLAGTLAPSDGTLGSPIGARLGPAGLLTVGNAVATTAEDIDFTAAATALNPVFENGGCLGAKIDITSVAISNIGVSLIPKTNALDTSVTLDNVVVRMRAEYKVACIGGSTNITVRSTKARVRDDLGIALVDGKLKTSLPSPTVTLEGFSVDIGGVPGAIEDLLRSKAREGAEKALTSVIKSKVPPLADSKLAGLVAKSLSTELLGHDLGIDVRATDVQLTTTGVFVAVDTTMVVAGGEGGTFVSTPMPILAHDADDLGVVVADDAVNQLFAGLWAAGVFDLALSIEAVGPVAALLDDDVRTLEVSLALPPTVTTQQTLELAVGDLIITARDQAGLEVQRFALSLRTTLVANPSAGRIALTTTTPTVFAQMLAQSEAVDRPLDDEQVEGIVTGVWGLVDGMLNDALAKVPMPSVAGVTLEAPAVTGRDGYVVLDAVIR
jgi:hypothetical protein